MIIISRCGLDEGPAAPWSSVLSSQCPSHPIASHPPGAKSYISSRAVLVKSRHARSSRKRHADSIDWRIESSLRVGSQSRLIWLPCIGVWDRVRQSGCRLDDDVAVVKPSRIISIKPRRWLVRALLPRRPLANTNDVTSHGHELAINKRQRAIPIPINAGFAVIQTRRLPN